MGEVYAGSVWVGKKLTAAEVVRFKALIDKYFEEGVREGMTSFKVNADEGWEPSA